MILRTSRSIRSDARVTGDKGSIMLAMVLAIVVSGIVFATLSMVAAGERKTRSDQRYTCHPGRRRRRAGRLRPDQPTRTLFDDRVAAERQRRPGGRHHYTWTATRANASAVSWAVTSTANGRFGTESSTRTVAAAIAQSSLFPMAAFADPHQLQRTTTRSPIRWPARASSGRTRPSR